MLISADFMPLLGERINMQIGIVKLIFCPYGNAGDV
jgi:hypothetical protein